MPALIAAKSGAILIPAALICYAGIVKSAQISFSSGILGAMVCTKSALVAPPLKHDILTKCDLLPYIPFNEDFIMQGIRSLNRDAPIFRTSNVTGEGFDLAAEWLTTAAEAALSSVNK